MATASSAPAHISRFSFSLGYNELSIELYEQQLVIELTNEYRKHSNVLSKVLHKKVITDQ